MRKNTIYLFNQLSVDAFCCTKMRTVWFMLDIMMQGSFLTVFIAVAVYILNLYMSTPTTNRNLNRHQKSISKKESIIREKLLKNPHRKIDEMCSSLTGTCFTIVDNITEINGTILAYRGLRSKGENGVLLLTDARILPPTPLTWANFNTKKWRIHKQTVRLSYARMMIASSFFSGALNFQSEILQNVLIVGLGGGVINNYMATMKYQKLDITVVDIDPIMKDIAKKWYDLEESPNHRIIVDDGIRHIITATRSGYKYDVVLLDACYNDRRDLMCPLEEFLEDESIIAIRKVVKYGGAVIINIITNKNATVEAERVNFHYSRHFPSCYLMQYSEHDRILICSTKEGNSWLNNRDEIHNRYEFINRELSFQL